MRLNNIWTIAIFTFVLWVSYCLRTQSRPLRAAPLILLVAMIPFGYVADFIVILVPISIFALSIVFRRAYLIDNGSLRDITRIYVIFVITMAALIISITGGLGVGYLLFSVVCAIALSRDVRHDISTLEDPVYRAFSFTTILSMVGVAFLVASDIGRRVIDGFIGLLVRGYLAIVGLIGRGPMPNMDWLWPLENEEAYDEAESLLEGAIEAYEQTSTVFDVFAAFSTITIVIAIGVVAILIAVCIWISRKIFMAFGKENEGVVLEREMISAIEPNKKRPGDRLKGYSGAVRRYYKRFVKLIAKRGGKLQPHHTSYDMAGFSDHILGDDGNDLRNVYIRARYSQDEISKQDIITARDALKRLKGR